MALEKLYDKEEALRNIKLKKSLTERLRGIKRFEHKEYDEKKKQDQPVIDAITNLGKDLGEKLALYTLPTEKPFKQLKAIADVKYKNSSFAEANGVSSPLSSRIPVLEQNKGMPTRGISDSETPKRRPLPIASNTGREIVLGTKLAKYLNNANESVFGLRPVAGKRFIGNTEVDFDNDKIIVKGKTYPATDGLLELLTDKDANKKNDFEASDLANYEEILIATHAIYRDNDPTTKTPKASKSQKYLNLIKPIWEKLKSRGGGNKLRVKNASSSLKAQAQPKLIQEGLQTQVQPILPYFNRIDKNWML